MYQKKNNFLNFCFSCMPGAGQMYQGFLKRGVSIMLLFFGTLALTSYFRIDDLVFCLPVIWFYGFFDGIHRNALPDSEYAKLTDEYLFVNDDIATFNMKKFRIPVAVLLIIIGGFGLLRMSMEILIENGILTWNSILVSVLNDMLPRTIFSIAIIWFGIYLIRGKRQEIEQEVLEENEEDGGRQI